MFVSQVIEAKHLIGMTLVMIAIYGGISNT